MSEFAWLDEESTPNLPAVPEPESPFAKLIAETRRLPIKHRLYLRALCENQFSQARAVRALAKAGLKFERTTTTRWAQKPEFKALVERYQDLVLANAGTSRAAVLLNFAKIVDYGIEEELTYDEDAMPKRRMRDVDAALSANDKLAKAARIYGEDAEKSRVTLVLDFSGDAPSTEPIEDAEFTEVVK